MANIEQGGSKGYNITPTGVLIVSTKTPLTGSTPATATVTGTSANVVASNSNRKGMVITNISSDIIYLSFGASTAVVGDGIALSPYGVYEMEEYSYSTQAINAISSGTSSLVSIQEFI